jgi:hypothetical protein
MTAPPSDLSRGEQEGGFADSGLTAKEPTTRIATLEIADAGFEASKGAVASDERSTQINVHRTESYGEWSPTVETHTPQSPARRAALSCCRLPPNQQKMDIGTT